MKLSENVLENRFAYLTLLLLASIIFGYFVGSLAFVLWIIYGFFYGFKTKTFITKKEKYPMILFSSLFFMSLFWTVDNEETLHGIGRQLPLFLFAISTLFLPPISFKLIKGIFLRFSVLMSVFALVFIVLAGLKVLKYEYYGFIFYHELVSPLELNAIYVSYMVSFCFLFLIQVINKTNIWTIFPLIVLGGFLLMLSSKMVLLITALVTMGILFYKIRQRRYKAITVCIVLLIIALVSFTPNPIKNRFNTEFKTSFKSIFNNTEFKKERI